MAPELQPGHGLVHRMANAPNIGTASINCLEALTDSSFLRMVSIRAPVVHPTSAESTRVRVPRPWSFASDRPDTHHDPNGWGPLLLLMAARQT